jgi:hypothetical protein
MENPDDDPAAHELLVAFHCDSSVPIYRVSPQLFVTNEHIMSDRSSTSSCDFGVSPRFSFSPGGSGEVNELRGLELLPSCVIDASCEGDVGFEPGFAEARLDRSLSARRFSSVPKSVRPLSSSASKPALRQPSTHSLRLAYVKGKAA